jgi:hypothetical protein
MDTAVNESIKKVQTENIPSKAKRYEIVERNIDYY